MDNDMENLRKKVEQIETRLLALEMTQQSAAVSVAPSLGATVNNPGDAATIELAERLCCACGSYSMGVTYETYRKNYFPGKDQLGEFWLKLAKFVANQSMEFPE